MNSDEKYELIMAVIRPDRRKKALAGLYGLTALAGKNKDKTIYGRTTEAKEQLREDLRFLGGVLTMLPALRLKRYAQFQHEGQTLLNDGFSFANTADATVGSIRKMKKFGERILRLVEKIERDSGLRQQ